MKKKTSQLKKQSICEYKQASPTTRKYDQGFISLETKSACHIACWDPQNHSSYFQVNILDVFKCPKDKALTISIN